jgi:hypothetical protein
MLSRVDRIQVTARNRKEVAERYRRLLNAEVVREDKVASLAALRTVLRLGASEVEILEPDGVGRVANFMGRTGGGLFAGGFSTPDPAALGAHLERLGRHCEVEDHQLHLSAGTLGLPGLNAVVTREEDREPAGLLRGLYEVTSLVEDAEQLALHAARVFGLDASRFTSIHSDQYGYSGVLTLFQPDALDRIEVITPFDETKTMGRFFRRQGPRLYMAYAEADDTAAIRERLLEHAPDDWTGPARDPLPDNLYVHPQALAGVMLGVSRTSYAWTWSGQPERVAPKPVPTASRA